MKSIILAIKLTQEIEGISNAELARMADISEATISRMKSGQINWRKSTMIKVLEALGLHRHIELLK